MEATGILTNIITRNIYFNTNNGYFYSVSGGQREVRLANTTIEGDGGVLGRLEVYRGGRWGTVCDDSFGNVEARVACAMISQSPVALARAYCCARSGPGTGPIWLDYEHRESGNYNCGHHEDVAIYCRWKM